MPELVRSLRLPDGSLVQLDAPDFWRFWKSDLLLHNGYVCLRDEEGRRHRLHRLITEAAPSQMVRLLDGDPFNLRRANLQVLESKTVARARRARGTSEYKGVSPYRGRWQATIRVDGRLKWLGAFLTAEEAAEAYDAAVRTHWGNSGLLNFPKRRRRRARPPI